MNSLPQLKSIHTIPIAIVLGGIIVAFAIYISLPKSPAIDTGTPSLVRHIDSTDHIFGNPAAKVIIIEYSDFDCEYCKTFNEVMHQIIANEGAKGQVAWVFRHFPLIEIHPNALSHARAAECAAKVAGNDAFWKFETALFERQPVDTSLYGTIAKAAGVPSDNAFAACYADAVSTVEARILRDRQNALDIGATGTPYSLILVAGKPPVVLNGFYSYAQMKELVDQTLAQ